MSSHKIYYYPRAFNAKEDSVNKALELFACVKPGNKRSKPVQDEKSKKYSNRCSQIIDNTKVKTVALSFLPGYALIEMRMCLMRHDWSNLQRLFPIILELSKKRKTLVWRYAITIMLHSPMSSLQDFAEFLVNIGCQYEDTYHAIDLLTKYDEETNKKSIKN